MHAGPDIIAQHAWDTGRQDKNAVDQHGLFSGPAEVVDAGGQQVLKDGNDRRKAGEGHKEEEKRAPQAAALHIDKDLRQGLENKGRSRVRLHVVGEACRKDDQSGHDRDKGIQRRDADRLADQRIVIRHVGSEDLHAGYPQAQGEEGLVHGRSGDGAETFDKIPFSLLAHALQAGNQVEFCPRARSGQGQTVDRQYHNQKE